MGKVSFVAGRDGRVLDRLGIADLIDRLTDRGIAIVVATHHPGFGFGSPTGCRCWPTAGSTTGGTP